MSLPKSASDPSFDSLSSSALLAFSLSVYKPTASNRDSLNTSPSLTFASSEYRAIEFSCFPAVPIAASYAPAIFFPASSTVFCRAIAFSCSLSASVDFPRDRASF